MTSLKHLATIGIISTVLLITAGCKRTPSTPTVELGDTVSLTYDLGRGEEHLRFATNSGSLVDAKPTAYITQNVGDSIVLDADNIFSSVLLGKQAGDSISGILSPEDLATSRIHDPYQLQIVPAKFVDATIETLKLGQSITLSDNIGVVTALSGSGEYGEVTVDFNPRHSYDSVSYRITIDAIQAVDQVTE